MRLFKGGEVKRGELVTSLGQLQEALLRDGDHRKGESATVSVSRRTIARYLDAMERDDMIERRSTRQGTWIKIRNFERYQDFDSYRKVCAHSRAHTSAQRQGLDNADETESDTVVRAQSSAHDSHTIAPRSPTNDSGSPDPREEKETRARLIHTDTRSDRFWTVYFRFYEKKYAVPIQPDPKLTPGYISRAHSYAYEVNPQMTGKELDLFIEDTMKAFFDDPDPFLKEARHPFKCYIDRLPRYTSDLMVK